MENILCKVTKNFDGHICDQIIEVSPTDIHRLERKGRVRRVPVGVIDPSRLNAIPPSPERRLPGEAKRTPFMFKDNRGRRTETADIPPTITRAPKREQLPDIKPEGPDSDKAERAPAVRPVGPDLTQPVGPDQDKKDELKPILKAVQRKSGWWHVLVDGLAILNSKNKPRNFRKAEADETIKNLTEGTEVN